VLDFGCTNILSSHRRCNSQTQPKLILEVLRAQIFNKNLTRIKPLETSEAKLILNLESWPPDEVLEEIIEDETFQLRDYFLRNPVIKVLFKSRIRKLEKLAIIGQTFLNQPLNSEETNSALQIERSELVIILRFLESHLAECRRKMASTYKPSELAQLANQMIEIQEVYEEGLIKYCHTESISPSREEVKAAEQLNTGLALRLIENGELDEVKLMVSRELSRVQFLKRTKSSL